MNLDTMVRLEAVLGGAVAANQPEYHVHFRDRNRSGEYAEPGLARGALNSSTDVILLAAPGDNNPRREIEEITIYNKDTAGVDLTVKTDDGTTERIILKRNLPAGAMLEYVRGYGWSIR